MFRIGQKVVCVDDKLVDLNTIAPWARNPSRLTGVLVEGHIYTITGVNVENEIDLLHRPCVTIAEERIPHAYLATRFRPLVETKTDISVFTEMLTTTKKTEKV